MLNRGRLPTKASQARTTSDKGGSEVTMSFQYFPLYTGDYLRDTRHLSPCEHGIYLLLLMHCWDQKGPAPLDERKLHGICNVRSGDEMAALRRVLDEFFTRMDDGHYNKRMAAEVSKAEALSTRRTAAAEKRWSKTDEMPESDHQYSRPRHERLAAARRLGTHTAAEWDALVATHRSLCVKCGSPGGGMVKDHITPLYQGGSDAIDNIQPLCAPCNAKKGAESVDYRMPNWRDAIAGVLQESSRGGAVVVDQTIDHRPYTKPKETTIDRSGDRSAPKPANAVDVLFDEFWMAYPRKVAKPAASRAWKALRVDADSHAAIMTGLAKHKTSEQWTRGQPEYIPHPATWLNQRRWEDDLSATKKYPPANDAFAWANAK